MIHEFNKPVPVVVEEDKDGYAIYVESSGMFENDIWCVVLCDGGLVKHYLSNQIKIFKNATFNIKQKNMKNYLVLTNIKTGDKYTLDVTGINFLDVQKQLDELPKNENGKTQIGEIQIYQYGGTMIKIKNHE